MSRYDIRISGYGAENGRAGAEDAPFLGALLVSRLREDGHTIERATLELVNGGTFDLRELADASDRREPEQVASTLPPPATDAPPIVPAAVAAPKAAL